MDAISQQAERNASKIAVILGDIEITYKQFNADIIRVMAWLTTEGISRGMRLGVFISRNNYWEWVCFYAAYRLGLTHVTLSSDVNTEIHAIGALDAVIGPLNLKTSAMLGRHLAPDSLQNIKSRFPLNKALEIIKPVEASDVNHFQRLALTSGTTGRKKVVLWSSTILKQRIEKVLAINNFTADTQLMSSFKMDTTVGLRYPLATWQAGGVVLFSYSEPQSKKMLRPFLKSNFLVTSPFKLQKLLKSTPDVWVGQATRKIVVAGGRIPATVLEHALQSACYAMSTTYGSTETGSVFIGDASLIYRHIGAVGFLVPGAQVQIVDEQDRELPRGEEGIIRTKTPYMVHKYEEELEASAHSKNVFRYGWFYPGDQGVLFEDGLVAISGRVNDTVNIAGVKISLLDLESRLMQLENILDVCVVKLESEHKDCLGIAVVSAPGVAEDVVEKQIHHLCNVACTVFAVDNIPRNAMGKVARGAFAKTLMAMQGV